MDVRVQVSDDHGKTFSRLKEARKHSDNHAIAFRKSDPDYIRGIIDDVIQETHDDEMAAARAGLDWERQFSLAIDSERARSRYRPAGEGGRACSMCGPYCVFSILGRPTASRT